MQSNHDHYRHWETWFHDNCLLEGYRNPAKDRLTKTTEHYIAGKRPFELSILQSPIPATEWNTLDDVIPSKIRTADADKPWIWLQKIKEHYVGASTLMQDWYHFWVKMSQWKTNRLLTTAATEEKVHYTTSMNPNKMFQNSPGRSKPGNYSNKSFFFCGSRQQYSWDTCPASGQTCSYWHQTGHFVNVCQQAVKDHQTSRPTFQKPSPLGSRWEHIKMVEQDKTSYTYPTEGIQYENCFTCTNSDTTLRAYPPTKAILSCLNCRAQTRATVHKFPSR